MTKNENQAKVSRLMTLSQMPKKHLIQCCPTRTRGLKASRNKLKNIEWVQAWVQNLVRLETCDENLSPWILEKHYQKHLSVRIQVVLMLNLRPQNFTQRNQIGSLRILVSFTSIQYSRCGEFEFNYRLQHWQQVQLQVTAVGSEFNYRLLHSKRAQFSNGSRSFFYTVADYKNTGFLLLAFFKLNLSPKTFASIIKWEQFPNQRSKFDQERMYQNHPWFYHRKP